MAEVIAELWRQVGNARTTQHLQCPLARLCEEMDSDLDQKFEMTETLKTARVATLIVQEALEAGVALVDPSLLLTHALVYAAMASEC